MTSSKTSNIHYLIMAHRPPRQTIDIDSIKKLCADFYGVDTECFSVKSNCPEVARLKHLACYVVYNYAFGSLRAWGIGLGYTKLGAHTAIYYGNRAISNACFQSKQFKRRIAEFDEKITSAFDVKKLCNSRGQRKR